MDLKDKHELEESGVEVLQQIDENKSYEYFVCRYCGTQKERRMNIDIDKITVLIVTKSSGRIKFMTPEQYVMRGVNALAKVMSSKNRKLKAV